MINIYKILEDKKIKKTNQRINILKVISNEGHISIEKIYKKVLKENQTISLATIYKNIEFLIKKEIIKELNIAGVKLYEINKEIHYHIIKNNNIEDRIFTKKELQKIKDILNLPEIYKIDLSIYTK